MQRRQFLGASAVLAAGPSLTACDRNAEKYPVTTKVGFDPSGFGAKSTAEEVTLSLIHI